ncbi:MAG: hypothetical protein KZQ88_15250 [Candidatus Thiodiazotropha sp. (ex Dulcina madagascariensis)]|nr:hypothetical protein [Candidatus Thiodiazotropha sp. (ex Dulcina madagascariensis)]MCU7926035.1 hypothetical protein [Candidatus Thiodiazotropha sp. (ex Dulcina madagascariensis)]
MINKDILPTGELPVYEVQEVSLLDALLLLKGHGKSTHESSITRAVEQRNLRMRSQSQAFDWSMMGP